MSRIVQEASTGAKPKSSKTGLPLDYSPEKCPNCKQYFGDMGETPYIGLCGHSVCLTCLNFYTSQPANEVVCSICKIPIMNADYFENTALMNIINDKIKYFGHETSFDLLLREIKHKVGARYSSIKNAQIVWKDCYFKHLKMQLSLNFWAEEMEKAEKLATSSHKSDDLAFALNKASKHYFLLDKLIKEIEENIAMISAKLKNDPDSKLNFYSTRNIDIGRALKGSTKSTYIMTIENEKEYFFKMTPGDGFVHIYSGIEREHMEKDFESKIQVIHDYSLNIQTAKHLFVDIKFTQKDNSETKRRIYFEVNHSKTVFQNRLISLFIGQYNFSYKNTIVQKDTEGVVFMESPEINAFLTLPSSKKTEEENPVDKAACKPSHILAFKEGYSGSLIILTNARSKLSRTPYYFGCVYSGIEFLKKINSNKGVVEECGVVISYTSRKRVVQND